MTDSLYKQALCGDAGPTPSLSRGVIEATKHQIWAAHRGKTSAAARTEYVKVVDEILGTRWHESELSTGPDNTSQSSLTGMADRDWVSEIDGEKSEVANLRGQSELHVALPPPDPQDEGYPTLPHSRSARKEAPVVECTGEYAWLAAQVVPSLRKLASRVRLESMAASLLCLDRHYAHVL